MFPPTWRSLTPTSLDSSKDPYIVDILHLNSEADEPRLEQPLMDRMVEVLREIGTMCISSRNTQES